MDAGIGLEDAATWDLSPLKGTLTPEPGTETTPADLSAEAASPAVLDLSLPLVPKKPAPTRPLLHPPDAGLSEVKRPAENKPAVEKTSPMPSTPPLETQINIVGINPGGTPLSPQQTGLMLRALYAHRLCEPRRRINLIREHNGLTVTAPWPERLTEAAANQFSTHLRTLWLEQPTPPETPVRVVIVCSGK
jgi:hypothetical protein